MAVQYYMRAYNTTLSIYVEWVVNDEPDTTGIFSGYPVIQLTNIIVNRFINSGSSKLLNDQFLTGIDSTLSDINLIGIDSLNRIKLGTSSNINYLPGSNIIDGYISHTSTNVASSGFIREVNNTNIISFRDSLNANNISALSSDSANKILIGDTINSGIKYNTSNSSSHSFEINSIPKLKISDSFIEFDSSCVTPTISQLPLATATGKPISVQAQNVTGAGSIGGNVILTSGTGAANSGNVILQTGGINQVIVTPTSTTILGNLIVNGTTTTTSSSVVQASNRVINLNSSAGSYPTNAPVPTQITGFAIDRGTTSTPSIGTKRDYYGLFWVESDSYWKFAANTDGYTTQNSLNETLSTIANTFVAQPSSAITAGAIPTVGGFKSLNNTVAVSSRNNLGTLDLSLISTNTSNKIIIGDNNNTGQIFNTVSGNSYSFQANGSLGYSLTINPTGSTNLQVASTVTSIVYNQASASSVTGASTTIQSQNVTAAGSTGGNLILTSGSGFLSNGNINLQVGGDTTASLVSNKFVFNAGKRRNITNITSTYSIVQSNDLIIISSLTVAFTISLPLAISSSNGDEYQVKDITGNAATFNVTISGNGSNIDGFPTFNLNQPYAAATFTFNNNQWSVS